MKRLIYLLLPWMIFSSAFAQTTGLSFPFKTVSDKQLDPGLYYVETLIRHPEARRAGLQVDIATARLRMARGGFDPKLYGSWDEKQYDKKRYWQYLETGIKLPTNWGWEIKGAYTYNNGLFINPEDKLPASGQALLGISAPLGAGLMIDARRAFLQQAKIGIDAAPWERQSIANQLIWDAVQAYVGWSVSFGALRIQDQALSVARQRLSAIRATFEAGDYAAIDTLEAFIQVQTRALALNDASIDYRQATLLAGNYRWDESGNPILLSEEEVPQIPERLIVSYENKVNLDTLQALKEFLSQTHPDLVLYRYKLADLDVERRLKSEYLKPTLNVNYNFLSRPEAFEGQGGLENVPLLESFNTQNYKWGVEMEFPLFLRKERGSLGLTRAKIQETRFKQDQKTLELINKVEAYYTELTVLSRQIELYRVVTQDYTRLLRAEEVKFFAGESSIFLINSRESKLIEAQLKLNELNAKFYKAYMGMNWAAGRLPGVILN